jgi:hypothetical protein
MKISKNWFLSTLMIALFAFTSCEKKDEKNVSFETTDSKLTSVSQWFPAEKSQPLTIMVMDQTNTPIANAQVLIGNYQGRPFKNNFLTTDNSGTVSISRDDWTTPANVTADASLFIRQTLLSQKPGNIIIRMNRAQMRQRAKISGVVSGLPIVNGDKNIDFGLVMSSLSKADLFNFDIGSVISPYSDVLSAVGQEFSVPTNVSLPSQKEKYIINITLDKPIYSLYLPSLGTKRLFATAGRFVFKPVVDELRSGKPFYELINYFDLTGGTLREINVASSETQLNFPAKELLFTKPVKVKSPKINSDEVFLSLTANELAGQLVPTGIRKLNSEESADLTVIDGSPVFLVSALKRQSEFMGNAPGDDRISASMLPYTKDFDGTLLPLIANPTIKTTDGYVVTTPAITAPSKITPLAVFAAVSDVYEDVQGDKKVTLLVRRWDVLTKQWPSQLQLPIWPLDAQPTTTKKRFEVNLIGGIDAPAQELGDDLVQSATHVTRSSIDF